MKEWREDLLAVEAWQHDDICRLLNLRGEDADDLHQMAYEIKKKEVGDKIYLRGLIEFSNRCQKNCYYCGIRGSNQKISRYQLTEMELQKLVALAYKQGLHSLVLQSGEQTGEDFIALIESMLLYARKLTDSRMRITLSCGEQERATYERWFKAGASRYLLRFESSSRELYESLHPKDHNHQFQVRMSALSDLREIGYQVGSGMMIGVPNQTVEQMAFDLLLLRDLDVDMVGMGPFIEHHDTPLFNHPDLLSIDERLRLALNCIAILRLMMKDINIAATTALETISDDGKRLGILAGANVVMPNITPLKYREHYFLYDNKPIIALDLLEVVEKLRRSLPGEIACDEVGDSCHYRKRIE